MFDENKNSTKETDTAFAVVVLLLNVCVLAAAFGIGWLSYWLVTQSIRLESILRVASVN